MSHANTILGGGSPAGTKASYGDEGPQAWARKTDKWDRRRSSMAPSGQRITDLVALIGQGTPLYGSDDRGTQASVLRAMGWGPKPQGQAGTEQRWKYSTQQQTQATELVRDLTYEEARAYDPNYLGPSSRKRDPVKVQGTGAQLWSNAPPSGLWSGGGYAAPGSSKKQVWNPFPPPPPPTGVMSQKDKADFLSSIGPPKWSGGFLGLGKRTYSEELSGRPGPWVDPNQLVGGGSRVPQVAASRQQAAAEAAGITPPGEQRQAKRITSARRRGRASRMTNRQPLGTGSGAEYLG